MFIKKISLLSFLLIFFSYSYSLEEKVIRPVSRNGKPYIIAGQEFILQQDVTFRWLKSDETIQESSFKYFMWLANYISIASQEEKEAIARKVLFHEYLPRKKDARLSYSKADQALVYKGLVGARHMVFSEETRELLQFFGKFLYHYSGHWTISHLEYLSYTGSFYYDDHQKKTMYSIPLVYCGNGTELLEKKYKKEEEELVGASLLSLLEGNE